MEIRNVTPAELPQAAKSIIAAAGASRIWTFRGEMGAGKTTLIKAICRELEVGDEPSSPTFSIVNEYQRPGGEPVYHFDLYRIRNIAELYDIGYEDYFSQGLCLIEWPENAKEILDGEEVFRVTLKKVSADTRDIFF